MRSSLLAGRRGVTLLELIASMIIGGLLAGGVMMAFLASRRVLGVATNTAEAAYRAQQTIEKFRNKIACRQTGESTSDTWYNGTDCAPDVSSSWTDDTLPAGTGILAYGATRQYQVTALNCDGVAAAGDCLQVQAKVSWAEPQ